MQKVQVKIAANRLFLKFVHGDWPVQQVQIEYRDHDGLPWLRALALEQLLVVHVDHALVPVGQQPGTCAVVDLDEGAWRRQTPDDGQGKVRDAGTCGTPMGRIRLVAL